jgi:hypothetical protein
MNDVTHVWQKTSSLRTEAVVLCVGVKQSPDYEEGNVKHCGTAGMGECVFRMRISLGGDCFVVMSRQGRDDSSQ